MEPAEVDTGAKADEVVLVENVVAGLFWFDHTGGQGFCYGSGDLGSVLVVNRIAENDGAERWEWHSGRHCGVRNQGGLEGVPAIDGFSIAKLLATDPFTVAVR